MDEKKGGKERGVDRAIKAGAQSDYAERIMERTLGPRICGGRGRGGVIPKRAEMRDDTWDPRVNGCQQRAAGSRMGPRERKE